MVDYYLKRVMRKNIPPKLKTQRRKQNKKTHTKRNQQKIKQ